MKLHWSPRSPFVRKVCIVLEECGLMHAVEKISSVTVFAAPPNPEVLKDNPLGKIPVLIIEDGQKLFDSRVICEYLITRAGREDLLPTDLDARIKNLRWQALGDGLTDILLLWRTERGRGERADPVILAAFERKTRAALAVLENESADLKSMPFALGHVAVICALGQLDFRYADCDWKEALPGIAAWFTETSKRPSVAATIVVDDGAGPAGAADSTPSFKYRKN
ncbi:MAG: glutathione S-transferase family protein [Hyphomicrobiales bacterium]